MTAAPLPPAPLGPRLVPLHTVTAAGACSCGKDDCGSPGKHPRTEHGLHDASADPAQLAEWARLWPDANIGRLTGYGLVVLDVDAGKGGLERLAELEAVHVALPTTQTVRTGGGGLHLWFRVPAPHGNGRGVLPKGIDVRGDGGYVVAPPSRHASGRRYEWEPGKGPTDVEIADLPAWLWTAIKAERRRPEPQAQPRMQLVTGVYERARKYLAKCEPAISGSGGHTTTFAVAVKIVVGFGLGAADGFDLLWSDYNPRCVPPWSAHDLRRKCDEAADKGDMAWGELAARELPSRPLPPSAPTPPPEWADIPPGEPPADEEAMADDVKPKKGRKPAPVPSDDDRRPVIRITVAEDVVNTQAAHALADETGLFARNRRLVRIGFPDARPGGLDLDPTAPLIDTYPPSILRETLARRIKWEKWDSRADDWIPSRPPPWCIAALMDHGAWPVPTLMGLVEAPVLRADGSILTASGYDTETGLYLLGDLAVDVPERPTQDDAQDAAARVLEIVHDVPFASPEHRASWLAAALTPFVRWAFRGPAPLFLVDANVRGAGKGLCCDLIGILATGRVMHPSSTPADDPEEMRKFIGSVVQRGSSLVLLDNVAGRLGCAPLESALTTTDFADRELGTQKQITGMLMATWFATSNNAALSSDMVRRTQHIRLDCPDERPENRTGFRFDNVREHTRQHRAALVSDLLTILRAWVVAGRPRPVRLLGSFEGWSGIVPQAVVFAGLPDPCSTSAELEERADDAMADLRPVLTHWPYGADGAPIWFRASELVERATREGIDLFAEALRGLFVGGKPPSPKGLGKILSRHARRRVGGRMLEVRPANQNPDKIARWAAIT